MENPPYPPRPRAFLSLGSNLGDRLAHLVAALHALNRADALDLVTQSSVYETEPVGNANQPDYLNMVAEIATALAPLSLLHLTQEIEQDLGRVRGVRWGARTIDIDILCMDGVPFWRDDRLVLPHPRLRERLFVLQPFAEIAPAYVVPGANAPVKKLLMECRDHHQINLYLTATNLTQHLREANS